MCGVIGYVPVSPAMEVELQMARLLAESRVRGLHACGMATQDRVLRATDPGTLYAEFDPMQRTVLHARYSTSGDWRTMENNQPIVAAGRALAFNGVIHMGTKAEFEEAFGVQCDSDNDGEVFLRLLERCLADGGVEQLNAMHLLGKMDMSFAGCWLYDGLLYAGRNRFRPLWRVEAFGAIWYASTVDIFQRAGFPVQFALSLTENTVMMS